MIEAIFFVLNEINNEIVMEDSKLLIKKKTALLRIKEGCIICHL